MKTAKSRSAVSFGQFCDLTKLGDYIAVAVSAVGGQTGAAILCSVGQPLAVAAAGRAQGIQRAVAEQAVEILRLFSFVTGEKLTIPVLKKGIFAVFWLHGQALFFGVFHGKNLASSELLA